MLGAGSSSCTSLVALEVESGNFQMTKQAGCVSSQPCKSIGV